MNLRFSRIIVFLIAFLYLVNFASADYGYISENSVIKQCRCSGYEDTIYIKNTGVETTSYALSSNLGFVAISPSEFQLMPEQVAEVKLYISAPCSSMEQELDIRVQSNKGDDGIISKQLVIGQCQNLQAQLYVEKSTANPCEPISYKILIKNIGPFTENYLISSDYGDYINFSTHEAELEPEEYVYVDAELQLDCSLYGEIPITFKVLAENNNLESKLVHNLEVNQFYDYEVDVDDSYSLCEEEVESIAVTVSNEADVPNTYYFSLKDAPSFIYLSDGNLSLDPGGEGKIYINFGTGDERVPGQYNFSLESHTGYGDVSHKNNISLDLADCYDVKVTILNDNLEFCYGQAEILVSVQNLGSERESIQLSSEPAWTEFDIERASLDVGSSLNTSVYVNADDVDYDYDVTVYATILAGNVTASDSGNVKILSQGSCHYVTPEKFHYSMVRELIHHFYITFKNNGKTAGSYKLGIEDENDLFYFNQTDIYLEAGQETTIPVISRHSSDTEFGDYQANITIQYDNSDIEYEHSIIVSIKEKPLYLKAYEYSIKYPCHAATFILLFGLVAFIILCLAIKPRKGKLKKRHFQTTIGILALIFIVFAVIVFSQKGYPMLYEPIDYSEANDTHYIWPQDTEYRIPLSDFVTDPDIGDEIELNFSEDIEYITISVNEGEVVFTPKSGWYGFEKAVVVARDSKGAFTLSPQLTFEVVKRDKLSLLEMFNKLCWHIGLVLLLANFVLIALLARRLLRVKRPKRKRG